MDNFVFVGQSINFSKEKKIRKDSTKDHDFVRILKALKILSYSWLQLNDFKCDLPKSIRQKDIENYRENPESFTEKVFDECQNNKEASKIYAGLSENINYLCSSEKKLRSYAAEVKGLFLLQEKMILTHVDYCLYLRIKDSNEHIEKAIKYLSDTIKLMDSSPSFNIYDLRLRDHVFFFALLESVVFEYSKKLDVPFFLIFEKCFHSFKIGLDAYNCFINCFQGLIHEKTPANFIILEECKNQKEIKKVISDIKNCPAHRINLKEIIQSHASKLHQFHMMRLKDFEDSNKSTDE